MCAAWGSTACSGSLTPADAACAWIISKTSGSTATAIKNFFKAYVVSHQLRDSIDKRRFTDLATNPFFSTRDYKAVPARYRALIPDYVKDYVSLNTFM